jgi:hypothetical protein
MLKFGNVANEFFTAIFAAWAGSFWIIYFGKHDRLYKSIFDII